MEDSQKNQALKRKIEELEEQAARERQEAEAWLEKLKHQHEVNAFEDHQLPDQGLQAMNVNYSYLQHQYKSLLERHTLLLGVLTDAKSVTFDEYISAEIDKVAQNQIKAIQEETENRIESLQSKLKELLEERASAKENNASLSNAMSTKLEKIGKLEALVNSLTTDAKKSSAKVQELEKDGNSLNSALQNSIQSLTTSIKVLQAQSEYGAEKKRFDDERNGFRNVVMMSVEKLRKEEEEKEPQQKEEEEVRRNKEEEDKLTEEEKGVRRSVLPRSNTPKGEASSAVFTPITCTESLCEYMVKAGKCGYYYGLDINKYNVLAVAYDHYSVYLYSEFNKREEKLCSCPYVVSCLAWNQQGTLLAIGGWHANNTNDTIQVWDIPNRRITKRLKIKDNDQNCWCLDWKGDTITAGADDHIYHWNINDEDNDQDLQRNEALLPRNTIHNKHKSSITNVQWSNCKSKLATSTENGSIWIYNEKFKLINYSDAHDYDSWVRLQWCPWDNQVIATSCGREGYLKIWRVEQDVTLIKEVKLETVITNIKWIPSKKAIITAHGNNQLLLWKYPSLNIIQAMNGHTIVPIYLALNADESAMVSKSGKEMIFWKPFDEF